MIFLLNLGVYGRLNLLSKPMQIYNADESGINVVNQPWKVLAMVGRRNVYSISAAEQGKITPSWHVFLLLVLAFLHL